MTELIIYGRGGQGGVTLAKLIATAYFLRGKHVQAFGVYAAERSGAPLQAFARIDDEEITNHNQIDKPDHVVVLDRTLIGPRVLTGLKENGLIILNTPDPAESFAAMFPGRRVATIDATSIAVKNGLGTKVVPIVNTTLLGGIAKLFDLTTTDIDNTLAELGFGGNNTTAAHEAFETVQSQRLPGKAASPAPRPSGPVLGILDDDVGGMPRIQTGDWATRQPKRHQLTPPCNDGCPAGNDIQAFVAAMGKQEYDRAVGIILATSPFPGICGRVCPAPCMEACNRRQYDESIDIRELERYAGQHGRRPDPTKPWREQRVAVVGSGPAGLSTAYHLAKLGYPVTLYEAGEELGGVMRTGIPSYRLPREVLDHEIDYIVKHGVTVKTKSFIDRAALLELTRKHAAVFVGTGLQTLRSVDLGPGTENAVVQGIDFLVRVRQEKDSLTGQDVIVVGGGNTAMDAARSARRIGARSVRVVYRRTRDEMPAIHEEIDEAIEEGIIIDELVAPVRLHHDGMGAVVTCNRMRLGEPDESGRPRPIPMTSEDAYFDLRCDRVILALGQSSDLSILPEGGEIREHGRLLGLAGAPVFCGGDLATNDGTVTAAVGNGRRAAWHIHQTLSSENLFPAATEPVAGPDAMKMYVFSHAPRQRGMILPAETRRRSFTEVRRGFDGGGGAESAVAEAQRCLSCGVCNSCDRCMTYCPEGILVRDCKDGYRFDYDYCKGCGICATQCPRGVIFMAEL